MFMNSNLWSIFRRRLLLRSRFSFVFLLLNSAKLIWFAVVLFCSVCNSFPSRKMFDLVAAGRVLAYRNNLQWWSDTQQQHTKVYVAGGAGLTKRPLFVGRCFHLCANWSFLMCVWLKNVCPFARFRLLCMSRNTLVVIWFVASSENGPISETTPNTKSKTCLSWLDKSVAESSIKSGWPPKLNLSNWISFLALDWFSSLSLSLFLRSFPGHSFGSFVRSFARLARIHLLDCVRLNSSGSGWLDVWELHWSLLLL